MLRKFLFPIAIPMLAATGCNGSPDESARAAAEVLATDRAWAETFAKHDVDAYVSFIDSTAVVQAPNMPAVIGPSAIVKLAQSFLNLPDFHGSWAPQAAVAARSGEIGYTTGTYDLRWKDAKGSEVVDRGKYVEIWHRSATGKWKMVVESFTADSPATGGN